MSTEKPLPPPPPSRGKHREAWVGLFVVAGLAATVITLAVMTDAALFRGRYIVTTNVPNAGGIRKGDPVQMHGVNIGRIMGFTISQQGVDVRLEIEGEYPIPKDSRVEVKASGLLGGMVADVIPGASAEKVGWGDRIPGASGIGLFDKMDTLAGEADKVAVKVQNLLSDEMVKDLQGGAPGARKSLESLQAILKEQRGELRALTASLKRSAEGMEKVTTGPELERTVEAGGPARGAPGRHARHARPLVEVGRVDPRAHGPRRGHPRQAQHRRHALQERVGGHGQPEQGDVRS